MIAQLYKRARNISFEKASKLSPFDSNSIDQNANEIFNQELSDFENINELYLQIEICWKTLDFESLDNYLQQFQILLNKKGFKLSESFFENEIDDILFSLISNTEDDEENEEEESFLPINIGLQNLSISIIQDLFIQFAHILPQNTIQNFFNHIKPVITNWENDIILKILNCLLILCNNHCGILEDYVDVIFLLNILDQLNNNDPEKDIACNIFFYDDDRKDPNSSLLKHILLKVPPSFTYLSIVINNGECGLKRFSIFLWLLIKDSSLIPSFDSSLYLPKIQIILEKSHDYSLLFPSIVFLSKIWNEVKDDFNILQLFPYIQIIHDSREYNSEANLQSNFMYTDSCPIIEPDISFSNENDDFYITQISSITLYCISTFILCGLDEAIICIENGIVDLILKNVDSNDCQNQIKREAARCLSSLIIVVPPNPLIYPFIQQFYEDDTIIDLLINILEYDETDMDKLILKALTILTNAENNDLTFLLEKCSENFSLFSDLANNEDSEIAAFAQQFLELCEDKYNEEE